MSSPAWHRRRARQRVASLRRKTLRLHHGRGYTDQDAAAYRRFFRRSYQHYRQRYITGAAL